MEALEELLAHVPAGSAMSLVVVSHQRPGHPSALPEILGKRAALPVVQAADGVRLEPGQVYVAPPGRSLAVQRGAFRLADGAADGRVPLPIDYFFRSLAEDYGPAAIGIVLSGSGSDGTLGLKAIKGHAGMTMAQEIETARYGGMPQSAIGAGVVDYVRRPAAMAGVLLTYATSLHAPAAQAPEHLEAWQQILALLRERTGADFRVYKPGTAHRRVERRLHLTQHATIGEYQRHLQATPHEVDALFHELLIGVTSFFRDPAAFEALARALPALVESREDGASLRVWVAGCSTGEEVYSVAILLREYVAQANVRCDVQIFGTDLDARAIETARGGFYPTGIANDVTPERLARFFTKEGAGYRIRTEIRDGVVFATHDLLADPPFSRLDLLSCRNLLIYLEAPAQQRVLQLMHHGLRPGGLLVLGSSESVDEARELFVAIDRKWKIYRRSSVATPALDGFPAGTARPVARDAGVASGRSLASAPTIVSVVQAMLLDTYAPTSVVVDNRGEIVYIHGRTGAYLEPAAGRPSHILVDMARPGLRSALASVLREGATSRRGEAARRAVRIRTNGDTLRVDIAVKRILEPRSVRRLTVVTFAPAGGRGGKGRPAVARPPAGPGPRGDVVEELRDTKERLQHSLEELQATNEELMSANEELTSTNEELQSTNEEMETTKEEIQSLNEELQTVNAELQAKLDDLAEAHGDLQNLLNSTAIATIFLDTELKIRRFTPRAQELVRLIPADVGRPLADLVPLVAYGGLMDDARAVLRTLAPCQREVEAAHGAWYLLRILPYRTLDDAIGGLVLTFTDVTRAKQAEAVLEESRAYFESIVATVREPMLVLDATLRVVSGNRAFHQAFALLPEDVEGHSLWELSGGAWATTALRGHLERVLPEHVTVEDIELDATFPRVGRMRLLLNARCLERQLGLPDLILLAMEERPATR